MNSVESFTRALRAEIGDRAAKAVAVFKASGAYDKVVSLPLDEAVIQERKEKVRFLNYDALAFMAEQVGTGGWANRSVSHAMLILIDTFQDDDNKFTHERFFALSKDDQFFVCALLAWVAKKVDEHIDKGKN